MVMAKSASSHSAGKEAKPKQIYQTGKRKKAVAKVSVRPGSGKILINGTPIGNIKNNVLRLRIEEPFILAETDEWKAYDFIATVKGGGAMGQCEAARQAFARSLISMLGDNVKQRFIEYDRNLVVYDPRRTEPHKPPHSSWGPRRYKQRSKR